MGRNKKLSKWKNKKKTWNKPQKESISFYILEYKKEYEPESLVGTEYEYLLHEEDDMEE